MRLNLHLGLDSALGARAPAWTPARLFLSGASGAFYSARRGLFQDVAGMLPVSSPGQPVALMRDLSGKGNHATQPVASQRPTFGRHPVSGVRNLIPNNTPSGASLGVLGAGGALPTGWEASLSGGAAGTIEVVGIGADHVDLRIVQTASSGAAIIRPVGSTLATRQGDDWAFSVNLAMIDGNLAGNGGAQLRGTQRNISGVVLSSLEFLNPAPVTHLFTRHSGTAVISEADCVFMNPDFRVNATGPWDATFRIGLPQCERGTTATNVQSVCASGFDVTEAGQQSVYYLQPDGVDDWMHLSAPFMPEAGYTLVSAIGGAFDPVYGHRTGSAANAMRQRTVAEAYGQIRQDIASGASLMADDPVFMQRHVHTLRVSSASEADVWANRTLITAARSGDLTPVSANALFRFADSYASGRYYGGALVPMSVSEADRHRLQRYFANLSGVAI